MKFEMMTAVLCFLGWLIHWVANWGEAFAAENAKGIKLSLRGYIAKNPPAFYFSVLATFAAYLIGPDLLLAMGVEIPATGNVKLIGAFAVGFFADWAVYKFAKITKKGE